MTRKSPIRHTVHMHRRKNKTIHSYSRGEGSKIPKISNPRIYISPKPKLSNLKYNVAEGKDQSAFIIGYRPQSEKLVWMSPEKFLSLVPATYYNEDNLKDIRSKLQSGQKMDALWLDIDTNKWQVQQHEGRHRAKVAQELGIEKIPVVLYARDGYEWGKADELPTIETIIKQRSS